MHIFEEVETEPFVQGGFGDFAPVLFPSGVDGLACRMVEAVFGVGAIARITRQIQNAVGKRFGVAGKTP